MEYKILESLSASKLEEYVNNHIQEGWKVKGGICSDGEKLYQAMIRE